jgi:hypothetical protein
MARAHALRNNFADSVRVMATYLVFTSAIGAACAQSLSICPTSVTFPNEPVGMLSTKQVVFVTNTGTLPSR